MYAVNLHLFSPAFEIIFTFHLLFTYNIKQQNWIFVITNLTQPLLLFTLTRQKTLTRQIGNGNEVAGVKVGKFRERVHNFASTDQMEATNSPKWPHLSWLWSHIISLFKKVSKSWRKTQLWECHVEITLLDSEGGTTTGKAGNAVWRIEGASIEPSTNIWLARQFVHLANKGF